MYENTETKHLATAINKAINSISQQTTLVQQSYFQENKPSVPKSWSVTTNGFQWVAEQYHIVQFWIKSVTASIHSSKSLRVTEISHQSHRFKTNCYNSRWRLFSLIHEFAEKYWKCECLIIHVNKYFHVILPVSFCFCKYGSEWTNFKSTDFWMLLAIQILLNQMASYVRS